MSFTPLTKISLALAFGLIIIAVAFSFKNKNPDSPKIETLEIAVKEAVTQNLNEDDDADGLKNWEETLYKTDYLNPDTDGDGILDGAEIKAKQDPTVAGKGEDFKTIEELNPYADEGDATKDLTPTDRFSRDLIIKYAEIKKNGGELDENSINAITESVLTKNYSTDTEGFVTPKELILKTNSAPAFKAYANELGAVMNTPSVDGIPHETEIWTRMESDGFEDIDIKSLTLLEKRYLSMVTSMSKIAVPQNLVESHNMTVTGMKMIFESIQKSQSFNTDPIGAFLAIQKYGQGIDVLVESLASLKLLLLSASVSFSPQEPGAGFME